MMAGHLSATASLLGTSQFPVAKGNIIVTDENRLKQNMYLKTLDSVQNHYFELCTVIDIV